MLLRKNGGRASELTKEMCVNVSVVKKKASHKRGDLFFILLKAFFVVVVVVVVVYLVEARMRANTTHIKGGMRQEGREWKGQNSGDQRH